MVLDAGIQEWSHCRSVYFPSSRAGVMGRKVECDGSRLKVPFLQTSSSSKEETAMGGRHLWGAVAPKAMGWMESVQFTHHPMLELHLKLQISSYILKLWILNCSYVRSETMWMFAYLLIAISHDRGSFCQCSELMLSLLKTSSCTSSLLCFLTPKHEKQMWISLFKLNMRNNYILTV